MGQYGFTMYSGGQPGKVSIPWEGGKTKWVSPDSLYYQRYQRIKAGQARPGDFRDMQWMKASYRPGGATTANGQPMPKSAIDAYREAYDKANAANEARYQDILQQYSQRYGRNMDYINQLSNQQEMDAREAGTMRTSDMNQNLVSRGLTGTTIKPQQEALIARETDANLRRIQDAKLREKIGVDSRLTKDKLDFMERRTDLLPDMNRYAALMQGSGRYGGATVRHIGGTRSRYSRYGGVRGSGGLLSGQGLLGGNYRTGISGKWAEGLGLTNEAVRYSRGARDATRGLSKILALNSLKNNGGGFAGLTTNRSYRNPYTPVGGYSPTVSGRDIYGNPIGFGAVADRIVRSSFPNFSTLL